MKEGVTNRADESGSSICHCSVISESTCTIVSCPRLFSFNSHQWILTFAHSHTCKQAFTDLYMQISGGCCFSKVKKQHHLSVSEYVFRFTCFILASVICYAYFTNYYLSSAMCCAFEAVLGMLGSSPYKRSWASRQDLKIQLLKIRLHD